jgi:hypothetical protein
MNFSTPENFKPHFSVLIEVKPIQSNGLNMTCRFVRLAPARRVAVKSSGSVCSFKRIQYVIHTPQNGILNIGTFHINLYNIKTYNIDVFIYTRLSI